MTASLDPPPGIPPRRPENHKGDFGRALLIGGSRGMSGAISLAGQAALRGGAGLVTLAVPDRCLETVASLEPSYITVPLPDNERGQFAAQAIPEILGLLDKSSAAACGPGLGRSDDLTSTVHEIYHAASQPLVVDADALNALASIPDGLASPGGPRILTPHPGEFRRLWKDPELDPSRMPQCAVELAASHQVIVVLKGHRTLITDGTRSNRNQTGNPGMATGGSGDVLTGLITALLCQGLPPFDAARLGVHLHGAAGDIAAHQLGQTSLIASDLVQFLPAAFLREEGRGKR